MADKLDDMIAPDEQLVYRARYGFRDARSKRHERFIDAFRTIRIRPRKLGTVGERRSHV